MSLSKLIFEIGLVVLGIGSCVSIILGCQYLAVEGPDWITRANDEGFINGPLFLVAVILIMGIFGICTHAVNWAHTAEEKHIRRILLLLVLVIAGLVGAYIVYVGLVPLVADITQLQFTVLLLFSSLFFFAGLSIGVWIGLGGRSFWE